MKRTVIIIILFFFACITDAQQIRKVKYSADYVEFDESIAKDARRLIGNVTFEHEGTIMYCDSAYFYADSNSLDAYNNVYLNQGDTTKLYGDFLNYNGNKKFAKVRRNVTLINKNTTLETDYLDYDLGNDIAYYVDGGVITTPENTINSKEGYYYTNTEVLHFLQEVEIINPDYITLSDTLVYDTKSDIAHFYGPTQIISDSAFIYCEQGWHDFTNNVSQLNRHAFVQNNEYIIRGDSIYYDRTNGYGIARNNVEIEDTVQHIVLKGEYGEYYEKTEKTLLTINALMTQVHENDTLFLHADTLRSDLDTNDYKFVRAYHKVKFFRSNLQGKCDSLVYHFSDSVIQMHIEPIIWSESYQLTANYIELHTKNNQVESLELIDKAIISEEVDSALNRYNQIKGRKMIGYFKNNEMYKLDVNGNGQTVYFQEENGEYIGVNMPISSNISILLENNKIKKISFINDISGTFYPIQLVPESQTILEGFKWYYYLRPLNKDDIFIWDKTEAESTKTTDPIQMFEEDVSEKGPSVIITKLIN